MVSLYSAGVTQCVGPVDALRRCCATREKVAPSARHPSVADGTHPFTVAPRESSVTNSRLVAPPHPSRIVSDETILTSLFEPSRIVSDETRRPATRPQPLPNRP